MIENIELIQYDLVFDYDINLDRLWIHGKMNFQVKVKDAFNGKIFDFKDSINVDENYHLKNNEISGNGNFLLSEDFDFTNYLIYIVELAIPINIHNECVIINKNAFFEQRGYLLESDYQQELDSNDMVDPRWEKLDKFKN